MTDNLHDLQRALAQETVKVPHILRHLIVAQHRLLIDVWDDFDAEYLDHELTSAALCTAALSACVLEYVIDAPLRKLENWLALPIMDEWKATDADVRWDIADILLDIDGDLSDRWERLIEQALNGD